MRYNCLYEIDRHIALLQGYAYTLNYTALSIQSQHTGKVHTFIQPDSVDPKYNNYNIDTPRGAASATHNTILYCVSGGLYVLLAEHTFFTNTANTNTVHTQAISPSSASSS